MGQQKLVFPADCNIDEIEFFDDGDYILVVSTLDSEGEERVRFLEEIRFLFIEDGDDLLLENCLNEQNYVSSSNFPAVGSIAT